MGYKFLGYAVWQGVKWYIRRRAPGTTGRRAVAALAGGLVVAGGLAVAQRRAAR